MSLQVSIEKRLKGFSLDIDFRTNGEILGILGASGSGKSMTLRCIAGIDTPDRGVIELGGRTLFDARRKINLRPQQRRVGYLFQSYALFPNMTVEENIGCALEGNKADKQAKIAELMERFRLGGLGKRYPAQISGGQQQRVALVRMLAYEPQVLLLDEPFSALDYFLKEKLQLELLDMLRGYGGNVILVTHSRDEVYRLCKQLLVFDRGRCLASGDTKAMFDDPGELTVARLTGCKNLSRARRTGNTQLVAEEWGMRLDIERPVPDRLTHVGIRAHDLQPADAAAGPNTFPITVREQLESPFEWNILFYVKGGNEKHTVWWKIEKKLYEGVPQYLRLPAGKLLLLHEDTE